jgi:hypothetical protein
MRTWHKELAVVVTILAIIWFLAKGSLVEAVGSLAVILTFCHTQVAFRLEEKHGQSSDPDSVECYRWQSRYFCAKEICWLGYFVILGAWSALVGVFIFLAYPFWRKWKSNKPPRRKNKSELQEFNSSLKKWEF